MLCADNSTMKSLQLGYMKLDGRLITPFNGYRYEETPDQWRI